MVKLIIAMYAKLSYKTVLTDEFKILVRNTIWVPHVEQELLIISENLSTPPLPYLSWKELHVYLNTINTTAAACGAGTAYHFGEPEYTPAPLSFMERTSCIS
jgi:hypothetical protein